MSPRLELFPFRYRDPRPGKWIRARYRAERHEIAARYTEWETVGAPEIREISSEAHSFTPHRREAPISNLGPVLTIAGWPPSRRMISCRNRAIKGTVFTMATPDYKTDLERLRRSYVEAEPRQRWRIAQQRMRNLDHVANRLIAAVSAVEGFARSIVVARGAASKAERWTLYGEYRNKSAEALITEYLERRSLPKFDDETWRLFGFAVEYRNLLVHECTYLGDDLATPLINACFVVLRSLAESQGLAEAEKPAKSR